MVGYLSSGLCDPPLTVPKDQAAIHAAETYWFPASFLIGSAKRDIDSTNMAEDLPPASSVAVLIGQRKNGATTQRC